MNKIVNIGSGLRRIVAGTVIALAAGMVNAADYSIDLSHTVIQFRISHLGYSTVVGRFNKFEGGFVWDKANPAAAQIEVSIDTASIDSNWAERDKHIRSAEILDAEKFPKATFKSTKYTGDAKGGKLEGNLSLHGVTKPVVLDVKAIGEGPDPWGGYRAGFMASTTLNRGDYGVGFDLGPTAEKMEFDLFLEGVRK